MKLRLDVDELTLGDFEDFEKACGAGLIDTLREIEAGGVTQAMSVQTIIALCWVCGRQSDPGFSMDDARKLRLSDLEFDVGDG